MCAQDRRVSSGELDRFDGIDDITGCAQRVVSEHGLTTRCQARRELRE